MIVNLPPAPERYDPGYFSRALATITRLVGATINPQEAVSSLLLQSPNGNVYKVSVDNSGNLVTEQVPFGQQGSPPY